MATNSISIYDNNKDSISNIKDSNPISELDNNNNIDNFNKINNNIVNNSTSINTTNGTNSNNSENCQTNNIVINYNNETMLLSPRLQQQPFSSNSLSNIFNTATMNANEEFSDHYSNQTNKITNSINTNKNPNQPSNQSHNQISQSNSNPNTQNALGYYPFIANQSTESSQLIQQQQQQEMHFHQLQLQQQQQHLLQLQFQNQSIRLFQQQQQQQHNQSSSLVNIPESPLATFQPLFNHSNQIVIHSANQSHVSTPQPQQQQHLQTLQPQQQSDYFLQQAQAQLQISQQVQQQIQQRFNEISLQNYESRSGTIQQQIIPQPQTQQMQYTASRASGDLTHLQNFPVQQTVNNSEAGSLPVTSSKYEDNFEVPKRSRSDLVVGSSTEVNKSYINNGILPAHNFYQFNHIHNQSTSSQTTNIKDDLLLDDDEALSLLTGDENGSIDEEEHEEYSLSTSTITQNGNLSKTDFYQHQQSQKITDYSNSLTELINNNILTANSPYISEPVSPKSSLQDNPNDSQNGDLINKNKSNDYIPSDSHSPVDGNNDRKSPSISNANISKNLPNNISKYIIETVKDDKKIFRCAICDKYSFGFKKAF
ncbi:unnamed protein product [[Candida] boidinii]|nr:unnamed protein product [[Candida] boidinii]